MTGKKKPKKDDPKDDNKELEDFINDLESKYTERLFGAQTIVPTKVSCLAGDWTVLTGLESVRIGRAGTFRKQNVVLPQNEKWNIDDEKHVMLLVDSVGYWFTEAPTLMSAMLGCMRSSEEWIVQETLSKEFGFQEWTPKKTNHDAGADKKVYPAKDYYIGRPKRLGNRYTVSLEKEVVV